MSREIRNTHDQLMAAGGGVAIMPAYTGTRTMYRNGWVVYRLAANGKQIVTDPKAHWADYGKKWFSESLQPNRATVKEARAAALETAKKWIAEQGWYDGEWKRNRQRDYVPADINKRFPIRID